MTRATVTFDDWSGGAHGTIDPRRAAANMFAGQNMVVYEDGTIGPRPGLKAATLTTPPTGICWGITSVPVTGKELVCVFGDTVYRAANSDGALTFTAIDDLASEPLDFVTFEYWDPELIYIASPGDGVYSVAIDTDTLTPISATPGGRCLRLFRDRLWVGGDPTSTPWRMQYSAAADATTFNAGTQYLDVGYWYEAYVAETLRDRLLIGTQGRGWWSFTGTPAAGQLRNVLASLSPDKERACVKDDLDRLWYMTQQASRGMVVTNGGTWDADTWSHLRLTSGETHAAFSYGDRDIMFLGKSGQEGLWRSHGVWSELVLGLVEHDGIDADEPVCITRWADDRFLISHLDSEGAVAFSWVQCGLDRPPAVDDIYAGTDDAGTAYTNDLITSEWWHPKGDEVRVTGVAVDFVAYDWSDGETAQASSFTCKVEARDTREGGNVLSSGQAWSSSTDDLSVNGTRTRKVFGAGDQGFAPGFRVRLETVVGLKVISITAQYDVRAAMPGAA